MKEKIGKIGQIIVDVLFSTLMVGIFLATILVDKNIRIRFPNTVKYANGGYYMVAVLAIIRWMNRSVMEKDV